MHDVLGVELDVEPRAAIGNDAGGEQQLAARMRLALVVIEENTPGERCICETMTRSVPFTMNVPLLVMSGMSPM